MEKIKNVQLYSPDMENYGDKAIKCEVRSDIPAVLDVLQWLSRQGKTKRAIYTEKVSVRPGIFGQPYDPNLRVRYDGKLYLLGDKTEYVKGYGFMILTHADGRESVESVNTFAKKYMPTSIDRVYKPAIKKEIEYVINKEDVIFVLPNGEELFAPKGSAIDISNPDKIAIIQKDELAKAYTPVNRCLKPKKDFDKTL